MIESQATPEEKLNRLAEVNVLSQLANVCRTTVVRDAWSRDQQLTIHGWIYGVHDGLLRDLGVEVSSREELGATLEAALTRLQSETPENNDAE